MPLDSRMQVRLISPWTERIETELAVFSRDIRTDQADALLCEWAPAPELFTFPRRKAWYCCEPTCQFRGLGNGTWPSIRARLANHEFLYHGHPNPRFRVPHITHFEPLAMNHSRQRKQKAVAIVSNHGGNPLQAHPDIRYRNALITSPMVDLYGRSGWRKYRRHWFSWPGFPQNYRGELPGDWPSAEKRRLMSEYKVCVCLENMNEPGYFTEKFVEAVQAGCIPVYRASNDIRDSVLKGARWFDPSDDRWLGQQAIQTALSAEYEEFEHLNLAWLDQSQSLKNTYSSEVFRKIAEALLGAGK